MKRPAFTPQQVYLAQCLLDVRETFSLTSIELRQAVIATTRSIGIIKRPTWPRSR
jgi:hypothetical protein